MREDARGKSLVCAGDIGANEALLHIAGVRVETAGRHSIQRGERDHVSGPGASWTFLNHACAPNAAVRFPASEVVSLRAIRVGEEITYNYLTTEWDMAEPFACGCGAPHCPGTVRGFRHLTEAQGAALAPLLSPFLWSRWLGVKGAERELMRAR